MTPEEMKELEERLRPIADYVVFMHNGEYEEDFGTFKGPVPQVGQEVWLKDANYHDVRPEGEDPIAHWVVKSINWSLKKGGLNPPSPTWSTAQVHIVPFEDKE